MKKKEWVMWTLIYKGKQIYNCLWRDEPKFDIAPFGDANWKAVKVKITLA